MKKLLVLALTLPMMACIVGNESGSTPGDDDEDPPPPDPNALSGTVTADRTLTGAISVTGATTIEPGVTLTIDAGTTLSFATTANLNVKGTLLINGTSAAKVTMQPAAGSTFFGGMPVTGTVTATYAVISGGALTTSTGAQVTITDTLMYGASGDWLIMNGGSVTMTYSQIGAPAGTTDTTHCNIHTGGNANTINITRSNIVGAPYGLMFYGGTMANFKDNNWMAGPEAVKINVDTQPGVSGDFTGSYFDKPFTPGAGATITQTDPPLLTPLTDAGVRP